MTSLIEAVGSLIEHDEEVASKKLVLSSAHTERLQSLGLVNTNESDMSAEDVLDLVLNRLEDLLSKVEEAIE